MRLMAEEDVLLQLGVIDANSIPSLAQVAEVEESAVGHGQVIDCRLVLCSLAGVLLAPRLPQYAYCCFLRTVKCSFRDSMPAVSRGHVVISTTLGKSAAYSPASNRHVSGQELPGPWL